MQTTVQRWRCPHLHVYDSTQHAAAAAPQALHNQEALESSAQSLYDSLHSPPLHSH